MNPGIGESKNHRSREPRKPGIEESGIRGARNPSEKDSWFRGIGEFQESRARDFETPYELGIRGFHIYAIPRRRMKRSQCEKRNLKNGIVRHFSPVRPRLNYLLFVGSGAAVARGQWAVIYLHAPRGFASRTGWRFAGITPRRLLRRGRFSGRRPLVVHHGAYIRGCAQCAGMRDGRNTRRSSLKKSGASVRLDSMGVGGRQV